ncbi:hypothetical protein N7510_008344 [Penicillium lagena]|uniref:uncharacterized protein n=1 Tax=Penicillium lagena TaxID=94218 RepID=UPI00253FF2C9|nr:uncharacterized protein N7510_008344 [Penicillium lagena]KAJ5605563.1 hypothetical protein N7510_008344 [Penicillium lagena]
MISLHPVSVDDFPTLARIHDEAFANDALMHLMYGLPERNPNLEQDLRDWFLGSTTARFVKAVDDSTGNVLGWACWSLYLDGDTHAADEAAAAERHKTAPDVAISPALFFDFHRAVAARRRKWVTGKPASILQILVVDPKFQGCGAGSALVRAGLEEADRHHVPAWLEASSAGLALYQKCGFRDVGEPIDFDLSEYGGQGGDRVVCMLSAKPV